MKLSPTNDASTGTFLVKSRRNWRRVRSGGRRPPVERRHGGERQNRAADTRIFTLKSSCTYRERRHFTNGIGDSAQRDRYGACITVSQLA